MNIKDVVYGETVIDESVFLELIRSQPIQRLKKISQYGIPDKYYHHKNFSRYEHSLGVMLLLRKLGATLEEQVAGLLHDVSTLAFSHVADWIFGEGKNGNEGYHDSLHGKFISQTKIPNILKRYGFSLKRISDTSNFSLLENEVPNLCADRVDYALREFKYRLKPNVFKTAAKGICNFNGEIVFNDIKAARTFASYFLKLQTNHWGGIEAVRRYNLFSNTLRCALTAKIIRDDDFYKNEEFILKKIVNSKNKEMLKNLRILETDSFKKPVEKLLVRKRFRFVDPKIIAKAKLTRLSIISPNFRKLLENHRRINQKGIFI